MEPEKQIPCPFVTAQKLLAGKWSILILHLLHGRTLRFGQLQKQMPKMTHIVQTAEIAGSQRSYRPHRIPRRTAKSGIQRQPNWGGFLSRTG